MQPHAQLDAALVDWLQVEPRIKPLTLYLNVRSYYLCEWAVSHNLFVSNMDKLKRWVEVAMFKVFAQTY